MSDPRDRLLAHKYKQKQDRKEREEREKRDSILNEAIPDSYLKPRDVAVQGKTLTGTRKVVQKQKHGHHQVLTRRQARKPKKTRQLQSEE